jgi:hypothetical protein
MKTSRAVILDTIRQSQICLNPTWAAAVNIAQMAERLPKGFRTKSTIPSTVAPALYEAYARAQKVIAFNYDR